MTPIDSFDSVYFKREDLNLTGSAKDRAIENQIKNLLKVGFKNAVISSSGNAAISAQYFCQKYNVELTIFVSPKINQNKISLLKNYQTSFKPNSEAFKFAKQNNSYLLRQSTDPTAIEGYSQIGTELMTQIPNISSIFIPVGSGTTLIGISRTIAKTTKIFVVQPASYCPIAGVFDQDYIPETNTITDALSVKLLPLKKEVINTATSGFVVQNEDVIKAQENLIQHNIITSPEGALAFAGYLKAKNKNYDIGNTPTILLTGAKR